MIVIIIIGILASIGMVSYGGAQKRARDNVRRSDVERIAEAVGLYATEKKNLMGTGSGCGSGGNGSGWIAYEDGSQYIKSVENCLKEAGYLLKGAKDPIGPNSGTAPTNKNYAYMKYNCIDSNNIEKSYIFARLETLPQGDVITDPNVCNSSAVDTSWAMNYYLEVK